MNKRISDKTNINTSLNKYNGNVFILPEIHSDVNIFVNKNIKNIF